jgi:hypothetical protein
LHPRQRKTRSTRWDAGIFTSHTHANTRTIFSENIPVGFIFMGMVNSITRAFHQAIHTHVVCWYWYPRSFCFVIVQVRGENTFVTIPLLPSQCGPRVLSGGHKMITSSSFIKWQERWLRSMGGCGAAVVLAARCCVSSFCALCSPQGQHPTVDKIEKVRYLL